MPNSNLENKLYVYKGKKQSYSALTMQESRLKKAKENCQLNKQCDEFNRLGGDKELKDLENIIHKEQDVDYQGKKIGMDAGRENQFIKNHEKDKDNANPTGVGGIPKVNKGSVKNKIMSNQEVYNESLKKELLDIRYLIEYMNNNKTKI